MSAQGLEVIDHTVQLTHEWLNELSGVAGCDTAAAMQLLRATLTTLRDMLSHDEAAHLAAQLPLILRGMYYEGWRPARTPERDRSLDGFVERVGLRFRRQDSFRGGEDVVDVFRLLNNRVSKGEIADVRNALPTEIRRLWPEPA